MIVLTAVACVKFIARKQWLVAGSSDGFVHVYKYEKKLEKITRFEAHNLDVCSLAVHPTQPYVLSGSRAQIKLWEWDQPWSWKCIQTFEELWGYVCGVSFNPVDTNSFASFTNGLKDYTIQVFVSLSLFFLRWEYVRPFIESSYDWYPGLEC
jgi:WD40 repeat protein